MTDQSTTEAEALVYRPKKTTGSILGGILALTGVLLFYLGFILGPEDREAMSGGHYLLFSIVPIQLFCWVLSIVFLGMGGIAIAAAIKSRPALTLTKTGFCIRDGKQQPYGQIQSIEVAGKYHELLNLTLREDSAASPNEQKTEPKRTRKFLKKRGPNEHQLTAVELGAAPDNVKQELESRLSAK